MSFRDNLQHLRATRKMTQEQLAMLVGVSRQSVTKWEAERAYPEMDKLIKLTQIFDCTLDELVSGDLTGRASEPAKSVPATAALADITGYDEQQTKFSNRIAWGVALILLGLTFASLFDGVEIGPLSADVLPAGSLFAGVIAGLVFIIPACMDDTAFKRAHPFVENFYTAEQEQKARHDFGIQLTLGICIIIAGLALTSLGDNRYIHALFFACVTVGAFILVRGGLMAARLDVEEYNIDALSELNEEEVASIVGEERAAKVLARTRRGKQTGAICGIIMILATIVGLCLMFYGEPLFWIAWMVGGLLCGIAGIVTSMLGSK